MVVWFVRRRAGGEAHEAGRPTSWEALDPLKRGSGGFSAGSASMWLWGSISATTMATSMRGMAFLGIASSASIVCAPEGNGRAERISLTLKEQFVRLLSSDTA